MSKAEWGGERNEIYLKRRNLFVYSTRTKSSCELRQPKSRSNAICFLAMIMGKFFLFPSSTRYQPFIEFYNFTVKKLKLNRFIESENCVENDYNFLLFFIFLLPFPRCATENSTTTTTYKGNCIAYSRAEIKQHIAPTVGRVKWLCSNLISFETSNFSSVSTSFSNVSRRLTFIFMAWSGSLWRNWI